MDWPKLALCALLAGCSTAGWVVGGAAAATVVGARTPSHEIQQTYYLGVFDPMDQIPPSLFRVTVHGQAGFISSTRFASGWVPAQLVDSLSTQVSIDKNVQIDKGEAGNLANLETGRRLVAFGPEGFREVPRNHRLVVVMGANPQAFFQAIDQVLGALEASQSQARQLTTEAQNKAILDMMLEFARERAQLTALAEGLKEQK